MEKRGLIWFTDFTNILGRGVSLTSNVFLLKIVEREKWIIYNIFSPLFKMLVSKHMQVQSTCCHHLCSQASFSQNQLTLQVLVSSVAMVRVCFISLWNTTEALWANSLWAHRHCIAQFQASCCPMVPWPRAVHHSDLLSMQRGGAKLNIYVPWMGHLPGTDSVGFCC